MFTFKLVALAVLIVCVVAEPTRRRANFRKFSRQETAPEEASPAPYPAAGGPAGERLILPSRQAFNFQSARQTEEKKEFEGYHYPKPTEAYGPPPSEVTTEAEAGATTEPSTEETSTEVQSENLRGFKAAQLKYRTQAIRLEQQVQPIVYVQQYPQFQAQPQFYYVLE